MGINNGLFSRPIKDEVEKESRLKDAYIRLMKNIPYHAHICNDNALYVELARGDPKAHVFVYVDDLHYFVIPSELYFATTTERLYNLIGLMTGDSHVIF